MASNNTPNAKDAFKAEILTEVNGAITANNASLISEIKGLFATSQASDVQSEPKAEKSTRKVKTAEQITATRKQTEAVKADSKTPTTLTFEVEVYSEKAFVLKLGGLPVAYPSKKLVERALLASK